MKVGKFRLYVSQKPTDIVEEKNPAVVVAENRLNISLFGSGKKKHLEQWLWDKDH